MQSTRSAGFTVLEIITVLVVIGILSAVAGGVMSNVGFAREAGEAEQLRMDLRYAQRLAMASETDVDVKFDEGNDEYELPSDRVFINGARRIALQSDIRSPASDVVFSAQTGMPDGDYTYRVGGKQIIHINGTTGMIE